MKKTKEKEKEEEVTQMPLAIQHFTVKIGKIKDTQKACWRGSTLTRQTAGAKRAEAGGAADPASASGHWVLQQHSAGGRGGGRRQWCSNPRMREEREGTHRDEEARGNARQSMTNQGRSWHAANWKWKSDMQ